MGNLVFNYYRCCSHLPNSPVPGFEEPQSLKCNRLELVAH